MPTPYSEIDALLASYPDLTPLGADLQRACDLLIGCYRGGGKLLICGNGGSAADCEHLVGELMKGYLSPRPLPAARQAALAAAEDGAYLSERLQGALPAISLVSHVGLLTAVANDIGPDMIFAQQVYGYGRPGDVLMAISTSGSSRNVLLAVQVAHSLGLGTLGITGPRGALRAACQVALAVPHDKTAVIQERHLAIYHALCAAVERALFLSEPPA